MAGKGTPRGEEKLPPWLSFVNTDTQSGSLPRHRVTAFSGAFVGVRASTCPELTLFPAHQHFTQQISEGIDFVTWASLLRLTLSRYIMLMSG